MNFFDILSTSQDISTSGLYAAILDFPLPVWLHSILRSPIGLSDCENVGLAVEISFLSDLQAEI